VGHILATIAVLSLKSPIEFHCAEVREYFQGEGMPIGGNDLLIASPLQKNIQRHSQFWEKLSRTLLWFQTAFDYQRQGGIACF
jgi:hypothetical protein